AVARFQLPAEAEGGAGEQRAAAGADGGSDQKAGPLSVAEPQRAGERQQAAGGEARQQQSQDVGDGEHDVGLRSVPSAASAGTAVRPLPGGAGRRGTG